VLKHQRKLKALTPTSGLASFSPSTTGLLMEGDLLPLCWISDGSTLIPVLSMVLHRVWKKNGTTLFLPLTLPVLANFQNSFTNRLSSKFAAMLS